MIEIQTIEDIDRALQQLQSKVERDSKLFPTPARLPPEEVTRIARLLQEIETTSLRTVVARMTHDAESQRLALTVFQEELADLKLEYARVRDLVRSCAETCSALEQRSRIEATNAPR